MSAPVLVACAAVTLAVGLPVVAAAGTLDARQRVIGAADAGALAAADAAVGWISADPCEVAQRIAATASVSLVECSADPGTGQSRVVTVTGTVFGPVTGRARAGPNTME